MINGRFELRGIELARHYEATIRTLRGRNKAKKCSVPYIWKCSILRSYRMCTQQKMMC